MTDRWSELEALFHAAVAEPATSRAAFVEARTEGRPDLRQELRALLAAHDTPNALLDAPRVQALPSGMRLGPYAIDRLLGSGGMSTVYLAHRADGRFEKQVAVKLINRGIGAAVAGDRFDVERQILARLDHPNVARLLDAGVSEFGQPYLVMEWVDGVPLDEWTRRHHPPLDRRLGLWLELAAAVSYAHRHLVVHRDLKPSNVLVTADGVPKLLDFGIATLIEDHQETRATTRTRVYTPQYASPEQIAGQAVTAATDVYGLGLLLREMITGTPADTPETPARLVVPADLAAILSVALRPEPERRYASADQFADDVRRFRRGLPVSAQPDSWPYHLRRFVGRHRPGVALSVLAILALVVTTALALRQARIAGEQRARAEQVTRFITSFLGATPTEPDWALQNKGVSLRVVELADLVAERVGRELGSQPEAEATIRSVLAMTYYQMGDVTKVQQQADRAIALYDRTYPRDDPRRLSIELVKAAVEIGLGRFAEAEARARDVAARWRAIPPSAESVLATQLGLAAFRLGRLDEAEATFTQGIRHVEASLGPAHPSLALLTSNYALVPLDRGRYEEAARLFERSAAISRASVKDVSMPLAWALVNLSNTYRYLGRTADSRRAAEESLHHFEGALGPTHYSTIHALASIAYAKANAGEPDAEAVIRRGIANQASLPADNFERAVGLTCLGFVLSRRGDLGGAEAALGEALAIRRSAFKAPNWRIAETAGFLGEVLARRGRRAAARALLDESLNTFTTLYGPANPRTVDARQRLATSTGS